MRLLATIALVSLPILLVAEDTQSKEDKNFLVWPPSEEKGIRLHFFTFKLYPGPTYYFEAFLENTGNSEVTVVGCEGTIDAFEIPGNFVIHKKLRYAGGDEVVLPWGRYDYRPINFHYEGLRKSKLKEPISNHHPVLLKPGELALLFSFKVSKEEFDEHLKKKGWTEQKDEYRRNIGLGTFWDSEGDWSLIYHIEEAFGEEYGVWYGEIATTSKHPATGKNRVEPAGIVNDEAALHPD